MLGIGGRQVQVVYCRTTEEDAGAPWPTRFLLCYGGALTQAKRAGKIAKGGVHLGSPCRAPKLGWKRRCRIRSNLKMRLIGSGGKEDLPGTLYGKVHGAVPGS